MSSESEESSVSPVSSVSSNPQKRERKVKEPLPIEEPRPLREREIINALMGCGIYEQVAKEIVKNSPSVLTLTTEHLESFKIVVREALSVLEKEGVPKPMESIRKETKEKDSSKIEEVKKLKLALCRICRDTGAMHPPYPDAIRRYFRRFQDYKGPLTKEDWLCKNCYGEWYRDNREKIKESEQSGGVFEGSEKDETGEIEEDDGTKDTPKKEHYIRTKINLLVTVVKCLAPEANPHRRMLVRYIALNQLQVVQLPVALHFLRKIGGGVIDQEEFEKECGIETKFVDLFGYSSWKDKPARIEVLKENEAERKRVKEEKLRRHQQEMEDKKKEIEEAKKEEERLKKLQEQRDQAERETVEKLRQDRWKRLKDSRKQEDEDQAEARRKEEAAKQKLKDKKMADRKKLKQERQQEWKEMEESVKKRAGEIKQRKEERIRKRQVEAAQRVAERKTKIELDRLESKLNELKK